jgi:hypothetical protein
MFQAMPLRYLNDSPAMRCLDRGTQLMRLQARIIEPMMADMSAEQEEIKGTVISADTNMKQFVRDTMARLTKSHARWEDIDLMFQLFFCRYIDNFQIFIDEVIGDAVRRDPRLVEGVKLRKAYENLPADEQLERRVRKMSFMGLAELVEVLGTLMDFQLFATPELAVRVTYLYDVRNLITHNYGLVDGHFLQKHPSCGVDLGATFPLRPEFVKSAFEDLIKASADIQGRACKRFGLFYQTRIDGNIEWWEK